MDLLRNLGIEPKSPEIRQKSPATQNRKLYSEMIILIIVIFIIG